MAEKAAAPDSASSAERLPFSPAVGCVLSVVVGLLCAAAFLGVLTFGQRGEAGVTLDPLRSARVWLVRDAGLQGLGTSWTRPIGGSGADRVCTLTTVRFVLVRPGAAPQADTEYCECFAAGPDGWVPAGACER